MKLPFRSFLTKKKSISASPKGGIPAIRANLAARNELLNEGNTTRRKPLRARYPRYE